MKKHLPIKLLVAALFIASFFSTAYAQDTSTNDTLYIGIYEENNGTGTNEQILRYNTTNDATTIASEAPVPWLGNGSPANSNPVKGEGEASGENFPTTGYPASGGGFGDVADPLYIVNAVTSDVEVADASVTGTNNPIVNSTFITGLNVPADIALSNNGQNLYVASQNGGTIGEYNALTGALEASASLTDAHDIAINAAGDVFVTAFAAGNTTSSVGVVEYTPNLSSSTNFIPASTTLGAGNLTRATGMVFDASGNLWVANVYAPNGNVNSGSVSTSDFVSEYSSTGTLLHTYEASGTNLYVVFGLSLGPNGDIYAASFEGNEITQINPTTGVVSTYISLPGGDNPKYAIWGSDSVTFSPVPEPKTYGMMTLGGLAFLLAFRLLRRALRTAV